MRLAITLLICILYNALSAQTQLKGRVISTLDNAGVPDVTIQAINSRVTAASGQNGEFALSSIVYPDTLLVSMIGFKTLKVALSTDNHLIIRIDPLDQVLEEVVVNTGYQRLPKERATGSFVHIDKSLIERGMGYNILNRLEGVTSGLAFDLAESTGEPTNRTNIRIRGLSTINGESQPLIVVDNFPYEGSLDNINPNDVESITVLKDASAASIWGARAGNGVIVITTKNGRKLTRPNIDFVTNFGFGSKPDLFYDPNYIPSSELIDLERRLFEKGLYRSNDWTEFSPVVDLLFENSDENEVSRTLDQWRTRDIRKDAERHLYRSSLSQQYALAIRGGSDTQRYAISVGHDRNTGVLKRNGEDRLTLSAKINLRLSKRWELENTINFVQQSAERNGLGLKAISPQTWTGMYTYGSLLDAEGNPEPIPRVVRYGYARDAYENGLLDWTYKPLNELNLNNNTEGRKEFRVNSALLFDILPNWQLQGRYQYQFIMSDSRELHAEDSFFTRNLINRFTQSDLSRPIPNGAILDKRHGNFFSHYGRIQSTFAKKWEDSHDLNLLAGFELRQERNISDGVKRLYGYDEALLTSATNLNYSMSYPTRPNSSATIPYVSDAGSHITDRFVSYYGNLGYSFRNRYLLSASMRWDASNIFGVDFNKKGVPLWSTGVAWNLHEESYIAQSWIDLLKLRATIGANGNVVRSQSSLPYIVYGLSNVVSRQLRPARIGSIGNPSLSWEKVNTLNLGVDFHLFLSRVTGSVEWYHKRSSNLIGRDYLDPTTGIIPIQTYFNVDNYRNYANMRTVGVDLDLTTVNTSGKLKWRTNILLNYTSNEVTNYYAAENLPITSYLTYGSPTVREGKSRDQLYAIPWHGLDDQGNPLVLNSGALGTDYITYFNELGYKDLLPVGVSVAPYFGSLRNSFDWKSLSFSFNITWRSGHYFRKESIVYDNLFGTGINVHKDYLSRWQKAGDEQLTSVPGMPEGTDTRRDQAYIFSEALIENASSLRLRDVQLSQTLSSEWMARRGLKSVRVNCYAQNIGIIWKANRSGLDPDARAFYPQPFQINVGLQANF